MSSILAIIPARIGSKGAPRKNLHPVGGKPLITWTCEAAKHSPSLNRVIVSTDDPCLAGIAKEYGVEVPFLRPAEFATDTATALDVILNALQWFQTHETWCPDVVCWLQPTSPLRQAEDIENAISLMRKKNADAVVSVTSISHPGEWLKKIDPEGHLLSWHDGIVIPNRRQEALQIYEPNGSVYLIKRKILLDQKTLYPHPTHAYVMPRERSLDIDTLWDLKLANLVLNDRYASR